jgi:hypothetical protein
MSIPRVYAAINAVAAELARAGIPKARTNEQDGYAYRGIDDVYDRLGPLLSAHKLCILPKVLDRNCSSHLGVRGELLQNVIVKAAFHVVCAEDASAHVIEAFGEALDPGDKGTSKAMSAAYKYAILQAFCVPVSRSQDPDAQTHRLAAESPREASEPDQGWEQWVADVSDVIRVCETSEALDRVQETHRRTLHALSRERQDLYSEVGRSILAKRESLSKPRLRSCPPPATGEAASRKPPRRRSGVSNA